MRFYIGTRNLSINFIASQKIIGDFLTFVPNKNIYLNQPQQQQLAQKKVNQKSKTNEESSTSKNDIRNYFNKSSTSKSKEQKTKKNRKALRHVSLF